jgi:hypothetical protein
LGFGPWTLDYVPLPSPQNKDEDDQETSDKVEIGVKGKNLYDVGRVCRKFHIFTNMFKTLQHISVMWGDVQVL